jgi:hypothetical protein
MTMGLQMDDYRLGWEDPFAQLNSLRVAVKELLALGLGPQEKGTGPRERFTQATSCLIRYRGWPERLKCRRENISNARMAVRRDYPKDTLFHFERLTTRERRALADDIFALYEACLLDVGRMYEMGGHATLAYEIMYPKDAAPRIFKPRSFPLDNLPPQRINRHTRPARTGTPPRERQYVLPDDPENE